MGNHAANSPVENLGWSAVVDRTGPFRVDDMTFMEKVVVTKLERNFHKYEVEVTETRERTLFRKKLPEILISSHLTTTIFWPERICFEIIEASRPRR